MKERNKSKSSKSGSKSEEVSGESVLMVGVRHKSELIAASASIDSKYEIRRARDADRDSLGNYYKTQYTVFPRELILTLLHGKASEGEAFLKQYVQSAKKPRVVLGKVKEALFFSVMSNEGCIAELKPTRHIVEGHGLFQKNEVKWHIKDSALKTILNYGSRSREQHEEKNPTTTLEKIYELLEKRYGTDSLFAKRVDERSQKDLPEEGPGRKSNSPTSSE
jgi:hypothetical protein